MKLLKTSLITTTALTLSLSTAAFADSNEAYLDQQDVANSAIVDQSGGNNNKAGSAGLKMTQDGFTAADGYNQLSITQSSDNNEIGLIGSGVSQVGKASNPGAVSSNVATVTQSGGGSNVIGELVQFHNGGPGSAGVPNTLTVKQNGTSNNITTINQEGKVNDRNTATITMSGTSDNIDLVQQKVSNNGSGDNTLTITMNGVSNGIGDFTGFANGSGAVAAHFRQFNATRTNANVIIGGTGNLVGTYQQGKDNDVGTLEVTGDNNQLGVLQHGNSNLVNVAAIAGNGNNVGISQMGNTNGASVTVTNDNNAFGVLQNGNDNSATVSVFGDGNGLTGTTPLLAGSALAAAGSHVSFEAGLIQQQGNDNTVLASVTGNNNLFGTLQWGADNSITATVNGNSNQSAVVQVGSSNTASFSQTGGTNNAGIIQ
ncbi:beta strand repeat-containing protein [Phaeobacter gallaeciensis]|uniref:beta strand repeat-containing protein n=1 Tax=Phaeobacter gallaeciensis TaxID=60890 RepID=UPI00237F898A|nr:hypothetical protein [Phaeobacter gallaeciensis]MDE4097326.1 hypothetical protein [Phaeobacter gallaeciensis]MDE4106160.1 hypothetical protein [Phaeobacter gallaeciensis]MDE4110590.1 hypothetical protein [Phaeobacter gallaeciensis]MDE4115061.1 hypothetical protein [Phaeobacter gallaeciensis]MDE4119530.1 hypothetical protein [Phaeobacter gallaeciensis]